jgi:hypothetical protein
MGMAYHLAYRAARPFMTLPVTAWPAAPSQVLDLTSACCMERLCQGNLPITVTSSPPQIQIHRHRQAIVAADPDPRLHITAAAFRRAVRPGADYSSSLPPRVTLMLYLF